MSTPLSPPKFGDSSFDPVGVERQMYGAGGALRGNVMMDFQAKRPGMALGTIAKLRSKVNNLQSRVGRRRSSVAKEKKGIPKYTGLEAEVMTSYEVDEKKRSTINSLKDEVNHVQTRVNRAMKDFKKRLAKKEADALAAETKAKEAASEDLGATAGSSKVKFSTAPASRKVADKADSDSDVEPEDIGEKLSVLRMDTLKIVENTQRKAATRLSTLHTTHNILTDIQARERAERQMAKQARRKRRLDRAQDDLQASIKAKIEAERGGESPGDGEDLDSMFLTEVVGPGDGSTRGRNGEDSDTDSDVDLDGLKDPAVEAHAKSSEEAHILGDIVEQMVYMIKNGSNVEVEELKEKLMEAQKSIKKMKRQVSDREEDVQKLTNRVRALRLAVNPGLVEELNDEMEALKRTIKRMEEDVKEAQAAARSAEMGEAETGRALELAEERIKDLERSRDMANVQMLKLRKEADDAKKLSENAERMLEDAKKQVAEAVEAVEKVRSEGEEALKKAKEEAAKRESDLKDQVRQHKAEFEVMKEMHDELEKKQETMEAEVAAAKAEAANAKEAVAEELKQLEEDLAAERDTSKNLRTQMMEYKVKLTEAREAAAEASASLKEKEAAEAEAKAKEEARAARRAKLAAEKPPEKKVRPKTPSTSRSGGSTAVSLPMDGAPEELRKELERLRNELEASESREDGLSLQVEGLQAQIEELEEQLDEALQPKPLPPHVVAEMDMMRGRIAADAIRLDGALMLAEDHLATGIRAVEAAQQFDLDFNIEDAAQGLQSMAKEDALCCVECGSTDVVVERGASGRVISRGRPDVADGARGSGLRCRRCAGREVSTRAGGSVFGRRVDPPKVRTVLINMGTQVAPKDLDRVMLGVTDPKVYMTEKEQLLDEIKAMRSDGERARVSVDKLSRENKALTEENAHLRKGAEDLLGDREALGVMQGVLSLLGPEKDSLVALSQMRAAMTRKLREVRGAAQSALTLKQDELDRANKEIAHLNKYIDDVVAGAEVEAIRMQRDAREGTTATGSTWVVRGNLAGPAPMPVEHSRPGEPAFGATGATDGGPATVLLESMGSPQPHTMGSAPGPVGSSGSAVGGSDSKMVGPGALGSEEDDDATIEQRLAASWLAATVDEDGPSARRDDQEEAVAEFWAAHCANLAREVNSLRADKILLEEVGREPQFASAVNTLLVQSEALYNAAKGDGHLPFAEVVERINRIRQRSALVLKRLFDRIERTKAKYHAHVPARAPAPAGALRPMVTAASTTSLSELKKPVNSVFTRHPDSPPRLQKRAPSPIRSSHGGGPTGSIPVGPTSHFALSATHPAAPSAREREAAQRMRAPTPPEDVVRGSMPQLGVSAADEGRTQSAIPGARPASPSGSVDSAHAIAGFVKVPEAPATPKPRTPHMKPTLDTEHKTPQPMLQPVMQPSRAVLASRDLKSPIDRWGGGDTMSSVRLDLPPLSHANRPVVSPPYQQTFIPFQIMDESGLSGKGKRRRRKGPRKGVPSTETFFGKVAPLGALGRSTSPASRARAAQVAGEGERWADESKQPPAGAYKLPRSHSAAGDLGSARGAPPRSPDDRSFAHEFRTGATSHATLPPRA